MISQPTALRATLLPGNPELLQWHLVTRGYPPGTHQQNLRRLYIMAKLDVHELNFVSYSGGLLAEDIWLGWRNVMTADFADPEFQESWAAAKHLYAPTFVTFVDRYLVPGEWDEPGVAAA